MPTKLSDILVVMVEIFLVVFVSKRSFVGICNSIWLPAGVVRTKLNGGDGCNGC